MNSRPMTDEERQQVTEINAYFAAHPDECRIVCSTTVMDLLQEKGPILRAAVVKDNKGTVSS